MLSIVALAQSAEACTILLPGENSYDGKAAVFLARFSGMWGLVVMLWMSLIFCYLHKLENI